MSKRLKTYHLRCKVTNLFEGEVVAKSKAQAIRIAEGREDSIHYQSYGNVGVLSFTKWKVKEASDG